MQLIHLKKLDVILLILAQKNNETSKKVFFNFYLKYFMAFHFIIEYFRLNNLFILMFYKKLEIVLWVIKEDMELLIYFFNLF